MRWHWGLRTRLTIRIALVCTVVLSLTAMITFNLVEDRLAEGVRSNAEAVLETYLDTIFGGVPSVGVIDDAATTRFFYLDQAGNELTEREYFNALTASLDAQFVELMGQQVSDLGSLPADVVVAGSISGPIEINPDTGELIATSGGTVAFAAAPSPIGESRVVDAGEDVIAVTQSIGWPDGTVVDVGVSNPLKPVTDSLATIRLLMLVAIPALICGVAALTWLTTGRTLRPVHAITREAESITASSMHRRVPVPAANDEVQRLAQTVNGMLERLDGAQQRQRQLVSDASHELRSPVAASLAQLEVGLAHPTNTDWSATASVVLGEQQHLAELIDDLLTLSQMDEGYSMASTQVDLDAIVCAEAERNKMTTANIEHRVGILGNRQLLTRSVRNLIDNAARHARCEVAVTLRIDAIHHTAIIHVDDDGPGVPTQHRDLVFDRFVRLDDARDRRSGGTGLGLAIVRDVAHYHGGDATCDVSPIGGARFTVILPLRESIISDDMCRDARGADQLGVSPAIVVR